MQSYVLFGIFILTINAQLNPANAPLQTWSNNGLTEYKQVLSVSHLDAVCSDTKDLEVLPQIFTPGADASYTATAYLSIVRH